MLLKIICEALHNLVPFVQFKKREKHPWKSDKINFFYLHGCFSQFLKGANGIKSRKASHMTWNVFRSLFKNLIFSSLALLLTHLGPICHFYTPWKCEKIFRSIEVKLSELRRVKKWLLQEEKLGPCFSTPLCNIPKKIHGSLSIPLKMFFWEFVKSRPTQGFFSRYNLCILIETLRAINWKICEIISFFEKITKKCNSACLAFCSIYVLGYVFLNYVLFRTHSFMDWNTRFAHRLWKYQPARRIFARFERTDKSNKRGKLWVSKRFFWWGIYFIQTFLT